MAKLYSEYRTWSQKSCSAHEGILVASDMTQEWLLPWWLEHYRRYNRFPIAFVDLGMSEEKKKWCRKQGELISLPVANVFVAERAEMDPSVVQAMEKASGKEFWHSRNAWFKKPLACLQSPFQKTIWIDLDCEVRGSIKPLFDLSVGDLVIAKDIDDTPEKPIYNSGVFAFNRGLSVIEKWADAAFERNHELRGDQEILSAILREQNIPITEMPLVYNWTRFCKENPQVVILHWHGPYGKTVIAHQITKSSLSTLNLN